MSRRIERGVPTWKLLGHVAWRGVMLVWIGTLLDSWAGYRWDLMPISQGWFYLLGFIALIGAFARWDMSRYSSSDKVYWAIWCYRVLSVLYLVWLSFVVRYGRGDVNTTMLTYKPWSPEWRLPPSVIASFGWAFLWMAPLWLLTRRSLAARVGLLGLSALAIQYRLEGGWLHQVAPVQFFATSPFHTWGFLVLTGTIVGDLLWQLHREQRSVAEVRRWLLLFAAALFVAVPLAMPEWSWKHMRSNNLLRYAPMYAGIFITLFWLFWEFTRRRPLPLLQTPLLALGKNALLAYFIDLPVLGIQRIAGIHIRELYLGDATGWIVMIDPLMWLVVFTLSVMWFNRRKLFLRM
jgi:hypothetical protein